jgi:alpha-1,3-mannosyltransferase
VHCIDFFFDALAATRWLHRKPMVASTHGGFFHTRFAAPVKQAYFHTVTRLSSRAYARICATSENDRQMFGHIARDRTSLMENGVDVLKWRNAAAPAPVPVLISIGRFSTNKRIPCLFPVLRALWEFDPAWRLIVVGREYDQRIAELEDLAEAEMVRDSVKFVAAPTVEECRLLIGAASYFISASAHEGFGLSAVEALSAGLVPVLSPIPPFRELASRAGIGRIVDPERVLETARAIHDLHSTHRTMAEEWRSRAIAAADSYAWPGIAARFAEIYRQAAGTQGARLQMADDIRRAAE